MKNILISVLLAICISFSCQPGDSSNAKQEDNDRNPAIDLETAGITGLLQSGGLQAKEAQVLGVPENGYQLLSQEAYFLVSASDLNQYWGQCVTLYGQEIPFKLAEAKGDSASKVYAYERKYFRVDSVKSQLRSFCAYSDTLASRQPGQAQVQPYSGIVKRQYRPAPDIAYDYYLQAEEERTDSATGQPTSRLNLYATDFEVLSALEDAVRNQKPLNIWAAEQAGYAERLALHVVRAESIAQ